MEGNDVSVSQENNVSMSQTGQLRAIDICKSISYPVAYELELNRVIELAAYFLAEKDGFKRSPQEYWLAAERDF